MSRRSFKTMQGCFNDRRKNRTAGSGTFRVFQLKKDGNRYARPHSAVSGRTMWETREAAQAEADRMMGLNPGRTFVVVEGN